MKLSDRSLENHISPISKLKEVENITIVRDMPGPAINKVSYIGPTKRRVTSPFLMTSLKMLQMIRSSFNEKPRLVHSYLLFPHGYLTFITGKMTGRKVGISLIAGPVELYVLGGSPIGKYSYCYPLPPSNIVNKLALSLLKKFDVITVTGSYTRDYLVSKGIDKRKLFILPHVVDERFRPMDVIKDYDVIFIGRLAPVKHVETLVRVTAQIKKSFPSIRVAIVGDGEERRKLEELTHSLGLSGQIDFVGYQANTWEWYNRSKISVLTSEREGLPYAVIESLRCGVPTIVSDCGDVNDIVKDSFNGHIIPRYDDYQAYADAIVKLLSNPNLMKEYSKNCLLSFIDQTSISIESTWEEILNKLTIDDDAIMF